MVRNKTSTRIFLVKLFDNQKNIHIFNVDI